MQLTEEEEMIYTYLTGDDALPQEVAQKTVHEWWNKEPFKYVSCCVLLERHCYAQLKIETY